MIVHRQSSRRKFLQSGLAGAAALAYATAPVRLTAATGTAADAPHDNALGFRERYVSRPDGHRLYVRDYPGDGIPFVMVHGFPDNCQIYSTLGSLLSAAGRRAIAFDFLGFGSSDKPAGYAYSFEQQLTDLKAVVADLGLETVVPVAHDAGGPAAINFALDHASRVSSLVLLNCYYASSPVLRFPEFIELCANPQLTALSRALMTDPKQAAWLLQFQQSRFLEGAPAALRARFDSVLQPIINDNFAKPPSSVPAFLSMAADARSNLAFNSRRTASLRQFTSPVHLVWGTQDPYLNKAVADDIAAHFPKAVLTGLEANHWPQIDAPEVVARAMLSAAR